VSEQPPLQPLAQLPVQLLLEQPSLQPLAQPFLQAVSAQPSLQPDMQPLAQLPPQPPLHTSPQTFLQSFTQQDAHCPEQLFIHKPEHLRPQPRWQPCSQPPPLQDWPLLGAYWSASNNLEQLPTQPEV
jgi:hypothetical protein